MSICSSVQCSLSRVCSLVTFTFYELIAEVSSMSNGELKFVALFKKIVLAFISASLKSKVRISLFFCDLQNSLFVEFGVSLNLGTVLIDVNEL